MNATEIANLSMSELKSTCLDREISVNGDRRLKASYISAIIAFYRHQEEIATAPTAVIADPFDEQIEIPISAPIAIGQGGRGAIEPNHSHQLAIEIKPDISSQLPSPQPPSRHNASIVLLVPLIFALALFLAVKTTVISLAWSFARLTTFLPQLWRSLLNYRKPNYSPCQDSFAIDSFPFQI